MAAGRTGTIGPLTGSAVAGQNLPVGVDDDPLQPLDGADDDGVAAPATPRCGRIGGQTGTPGDHLNEQCQHPGQQAGMANMIERGSES